MEDREVIGRNLGDGRTLGVRSTRPAEHAKFSVPQAVNGS